MFLKKIDTKNQNFDAARTREENRQLWDKFLTLQNGSSTHQSDVDDVKDLFKKCYIISKVVGPLSRVIFQMSVTFVSAVF